MAVFMLQTVNNFNASIKTEKKTDDFIVRRLQRLLNFNSSEVWFPATVWAPGPRPNAGVIAREPQFNSVQCVSNRFVTMHKQAVVGLFCFMVLLMYFLESLEGKKHLRKCTLRICRCYRQWRISLGAHEARTSGPQPIRGPHSMKKNYI